MKTLRGIVCMVLWIGGAFAFAAAAEKEPPAEGAPLPAISLPAPKDPSHGAYLGLTVKKDFTVADIAAEVVIIQIFNMY